MRRVHKALAVYVSHMGEASCVSSRVVESLPAARLLTASHMVGVSDARSQAVRRVLKVQIKVCAKHMGEENGARSQHARRVLKVRRAVA